MPTVPCSSLHLPPSRAPAATVFLADGEPQFLDAVAAVIGEDPRLVLVGATTDGSRVRRAILRLRPEVVLLDVHLPGAGGRTVTSWLHDERLPTQVLFVSARRAGATIYDSPSTGGFGYLTKDMPLRLIRDGIVKVCAGEWVLGPQFAERELRRDATAG